jgi:hypothetical protein
MFTKTEEYEQEQEKGYGGKEEERRKQIISPKLSSSSIYALKNKTKTIKSPNKEESHLTKWSSIEEEEEEKSDSHFSKTSTKQSVTFKSQIR